MNLKGVWFFNKNLTGDYEGKESISFSFPENPTVQEGISLLFTSGGIEVLFRGSASAAVVYSPSYGWYGDFYRCMDFGTEGANVGDSFYSYILANAAPLIPVDHPEGKLLLTQDRICESNITVRLQMQDRTLTANGEYFPDEGRAGMEKVKVALSFVPLSVTKNGTYLPAGGASGFSQVQVDVERKTDFEIIDCMAYRTEVPENALPIAELLSFGGMTQTAENRFFAGRVSRIFSAPRITSWSQVQTVVRSGLARNFFQIGDQLVCNKGDKPLVWDIIGFDHDTPVDTRFKHSLTIQLHDVLPDTMQYDATEALFYCESELAAGTYHFTLLAGYDTAYGGGKSYQFTLTKAVPTGGVIMFPWSYKKQASTVLVSTYESRTATTAIESVAVTEGTGGTALDTLGECNHTHRIRYGSNNWKQSAMRQFLNSKGAAGTYWTPQTNFDRPPTWNASTAGFLSDLDGEFLEVVGEVTKRTVLNTVCDGGGYEDLTERFFLISRIEAYAGNENSIEEGTPYEYYSLGSDLSAAGTGDDSNRIKYRSGSATYWWLRSPNSGSGGSVGLFYPSGDLRSGYALTSYGVAPACCIV